MQKVIKIENKKIRKFTTAMICVVIWIAGIVGTVGFIYKSKLPAAIGVLLTVQLLAALWDIKSMTIPAKITVPAMVAGAVIVALTGEFLEGTAAAVLSFILMKLLAIISRNQVGGGDIAIMTVTGLYTSIGALISILFASVTLSGVFSVIFIISGKADKKTEIPFAPFILTATVLLTLSGYVN
ncbi:prepilin peptidase [Ruminiclostridium cellulolyticum]|uniref:Peptidase A24A prepilin type IV n=1 Tax=Ruminiclostridium cellulolyticum (strain ATCC 35319 / DSM 5812 / JCM 6584 / H10) TaxID=394503 RepID=B8I6K0_RUMCH|nr:A24 family peptidase [Ruminiclostridium cellulolyticum]ACL74892.1 peptidase A24A prepilin type IV [Ruminiclostridium cellulolyticum H10]